MSKVNIQMAATVRVIRGEHASKCGIVRDIKYGKRVYTVELDGGLRVDFTVGFLRVISRPVFDCWSPSELFGL